MFPFVIAYSGVFIFQLVLLLAALESTLCLIRRIHGIWGKCLSTYDKEAYFRPQALVDIFLRSSNTAMSSLCQKVILYASSVNVANVTTSYFALQTG